MQRCAREANVQKLKVEKFRDDREAIGMRGVGRAKRCERRRLNVTCTEGQSRSGSTLINIHLISGAKIATNHRQFIE